MTWFWTNFPRLSAPFRAFPRLIFFGAMVSFLIFSCKKPSEAALEKADDSTLAVDIEKAQSLAKNLAALVEASEATDRSFENAPLAEGRWALEAAGNLLWHSSLRNGIVQSVHEFTFEVPNVEESGVLKMQGSSLGAKFSTLVSDAEGLLASNQNLAGLDVEVVEANAFRTLLKAKIAVAKANFTGPDCTSGIAMQPPGALYLVNPAVAYITTGVSNCKLKVNQPGPGCYYPQLTFRDFVVGLNAPIVYQTDFPTFNPDLNQTIQEWYDIRSNIAMNMANGFMPPPPTPPAGATNAGSVLVSLVLEGFEPDQPVPMNTWGAAITHIMFGIGSPVCD